MIKEWLNWVNGAVAITILLLLFTALAVVVLNRAPIIPTTETSNKSRLPASSFELPQQSYDAIGEPALNLNTAPLTIQLPDLRKHLVYYGKNNRPDADPNSTVMHFGFTGSKSATPLQPKTITYLVYDKKQSPPRYDFSPDNKESALWIEVTPNGGQASVKVRMKDDKGDIISTPQINSSFSLAEKPFIRMDNIPWEIGKQRVDGTLLARQKARWYGSDLFFDRHGGIEFEHFTKRQRIDFEDGETPYSVFVQAGDSLIWNNNRWVVTPPGPETIGKPLLLVKKVDDRLINFEVWDPEGKTKVVLNLLKSNEPAPLNNVMQGFKFVGSRTRSKFVFEVNKERIILSPGDWLLQIDKRWKKLSSPDEIDAYVERKMTGLLFVFDTVERRDERQILVGTLFNKSRTDSQHIEMMMDSGSNLSPAPPAGTPPPPLVQKGEAPTPEEKPANLELHPHTREDIYEYQKNLRQL
jgi:hypothetical protein